VCYMNETVGQNVSLGDSAENLLLECRYSHEKCMITSLVDMENVPAFFLAHYLEFKRPRNNFKSSNRSVFPQSASLGRRRRAANQRRSSSPETASSPPPVDPTWRPPGNVVYLAENVPVTVLHNYLQLVSKDFLIVLKYGRI